MTNNKQQTAVEWQFEKLFDSFEKFNNDEYTFDEYLKRNLEIRAQAKEMEKEQIIEAFEIGIQSEFFHQTFNAPCKDGEQYYNETYGEL
jgi:hypothetical protein